MRTSGQTGCASKSAVAPARIEFQKFRRCPGPSHVQRNPIMYVVWGGKSNIFGARRPGRKKSRSQGVRSPDLLPKVGRGTWLGLTRLVIYVYSLTITSLPSDSVHSIFSLLVGNRNYGRFGKLCFCSSFLLLFILWFLPRTPLHLLWVTISHTGTSCSMPCSLNLNINSKPKTQIQISNLVSQVVS